MRHNESHRHVFKCKKEPISVIHALTGKFFTKEFHCIFRIVTILTEVGVSKSRYIIFSLLRSKNSKKPKDVSFDNDPIVQMSRRATPGRTSFKIKKIGRSVGSTAGAFVNYV